MNSSITVSLIYSAYIVFSFYLYFSDRKSWEEYIEKIQEKTFIPNQYLALIILLVILMLPINMVKVILSPSPELTEEPKRVITQYYPELGQKLEGKYIEIDIVDVEPLLRKVAELFENGFGESEIGKVKSLLNSGVQDEKLIFNVRYKVMNVPLVIEVTSDNEDLFKLGLFTNSRLPGLINKVIDVYVQEVYW